jgi:hypothetical protein
MIIALRSSAVLKPAQAGLVLLRDNTDYFQIIQTEGYSGNVTGWKNGQRVGSLVLS